MLQLRSEVRSRGARTSGGGEGKGVVEVEVMEGEVVEAEVEAVREYSSANSGLSTRKAAPLFERKGEGEEEGEVVDVQASVEPEDVAESEGRASRTLDALLLLVESKLKTLSECGLGEGETEGGE